VKREKIEIYIYIYIEEVRRWGEMRKRRGDKRRGMSK